MDRWYEAPGQPGSNVVYSRIRLVRNWKEYPFPSRMTKEQDSELTARLCESFKGIGPADGTKYRFAYLDRMTDLEKTSLVERRVLNRGIVKKQGTSGLILSEDESVGVIINGEDHIRIQVCDTGLKTTECYERAERIDDFIDSRIEYAFDRKYGYLTSYPTNVGTGLRVSVVLHLPLLSTWKNFNSLTADMGRFGTSIRGLYGEGGENFGALYRISNQKTLGQTEREIVDLVTKTAAELDQKEQNLRSDAGRRRSLARLDEVYKSYGVLKYARRLTRKDAMNLLSQIMAGINDGMIETKEPCSVFGLVLGIQPANLLRMAKKPLDKDELDAARADFLRERLPEIR